MKKVLFATSALVLSAGFASAEVAVSGDGRMGMIYDGNDVQFSSRARVLFTLTGESDAGLSFGGKFRVDQENYSSNAYRSAARGTAGQVWISGTYGKLAMGDVVSASEAAIGDLYEIGYTDGAFAGDQEEIKYLTADGENLNQGPSILYSYGVNGFTFYASASDGSTNVCAGAITGSGTIIGYDADGRAIVDGCVDNEDTDIAYSLAAAYEAGNYNVGLGYAKHGDADEIVLGGEAKFDQFSVKGVYAKWSDRFTGGADSEKLDSSIGLSAAYQADAVLVKGFYIRDKFKYAVADSESFDSFGIGADYDLGGGATLAGAIIDTDYLNDTVADLGVKFKF
ncbi:porin [Paracoccus sp. (in: a-proteobacteria)]|uniref:porin n=1 Tax=Paracoccus sp. TaxID=267 RepID=UPI0028A157ED|nr:porin [Paracoccus sp. (in: a-proteobacteria)]